MTTRVAESTWLSIPAASLVLVQTGPTEQHGPHLPLDTDTDSVIAALAGEEG